MDIGAALKKARLLNGLTQEDIKDRLHYSREMISAIETGRRRIPVDSLPELARLSPGLALVIAAAYSGMSLPLVYLDGNIDRHPLAMTHKTIEEGKEFLESVSGLRLVNKTSADMLTGEDRENLLECRKRAWEDIICKMNWLVDMAIVFKVDMTEEYKAVTRKLEAQKYIMPQKKRKTA